MSLAVGLPSSSPLATLRGMETAVADLHRRRHPEPARHLRWFSARWNVMVCDCGETIGGSEKCEGCFTRPNNAVEVRLSENSAALLALRETVSFGDAAAAVLDGKVPR